MEVDGRDGAVVVDQQVEQGVDAGLAHRGDHLVHALAFVLLVLGVRHRNQQHAVPAAGGGVVVVPVRAGDAVIDLVFEARAQRGVLEALDQRPRSALVRPWRNDAREVVLSGAVGIHVRSDIQAITARLHDARHQLGHLAPQLAVGELQMNDVHRHTGFAPNPDCLGHRLENALPLRSQVGRIDAAELGTRAAQRDERSSVNP